MQVEFFHKGCSDGFLSFVISKHFHIENGDVNNVKFFHLAPNNLCDNLSKLGLEHLKITNIRSFDLAFDMSSYKYLKSICNDIKIYDHHESTNKNLTGIDDVVFKNDFAGCQLSWNYFYPNKPMPLIVRYVSDRDLWLFREDSSKDITNLLYSILSPYEEYFEKWEQYLIKNEIEDKETFQDFEKFTSINNTIVSNHVKTNFKSGRSLYLSIDPHTQPKYSVFVSNCTSYISETADYVLNLRDQHGNRQYDYVRFISNTIFINFLIYLFFTITVDIFSKNKKFFQQKKERLKMDFDTKIDEDFIIETIEYDNDYTGSIFNVEINPEIIDTMMIEFDPYDEIKNCEVEPTNDQVFNIQTSDISNEEEKPKKKKIKRKRGKKVNRKKKKTKIVLQEIPEDIQKNNESQIDIISSNVKVEEPKIDIEKDKILDDKEEPVVKKKYLKKKIGAIRKKGGRRKKSKEIKEVETESEIEETITKKPFKNHPSHRKRKINESDSGSSSDNNSKKESDEEYEDDEIEKSSESDEETEDEESDSTLDNDYEKDSDEEYCDKKRYNYRKKKKLGEPKARASHLRWNKKLDKILLNILEPYDKEDIEFKWIDIAEKVSKLAKIKVRGDQCYQRYFRVLKWEGFDEWTFNEEYIIAKYTDGYKKDNTKENIPWSEIASHCKKADSCLAYKYLKMRRCLKRSWDPDELNELRKLTRGKKKRKNWDTIAKKINLKKQYKRTKGRSPYECYVSFLENF